MAADGITTAPSRSASVDVHHEVSMFLFHEADLLDEHRHSEWLALLAPDIHYWAPVRTNRMPRDAHLSVEGPDGAAFFDDDFASMAIRVRQLNTNRSWSELPASRTRHLVTNIRVTHDDPPDHYLVRSSFLLYRSRGDRYQDVLPGIRNDLLRRTKSGFEIARRHILIDQSVLFAVNITTFL